MPDRGIIFSGPMVRALLDGRKHQTRRILKPQPDPALPIGGADFVVMPGERGSWCWLNGWDGSIIDSFSVPYAPGDRLYVREAWRTSDAFNNFSPSALTGGAPVQWEADGARSRSWRDDLQAQDQPGRYRHARHMPRWASRLTLTVTDVRVQRLQEISEGDAEAEGIRADAAGAGTYIGREGPGRWVTPWLTAVEAFADLWNSLHGPDAWAENPWVCAISFETKRGNIDDRAD